CIEPALWFLADWSLRWALLIALLAIGLAVLRPRRAATRSLVCWLVFLVGLSLPALPRWGVGFALPPPRPTPPHLPAPGTPVYERGTQDAVVEGQVAPHTNAEQHVEALPPVERPPSAEQPDMPPEEPLGVRRVILVGVATLWLTGVCVLLVRWLGGRLFL